MSRNRGTPKCSFEHLFSLSIDLKLLIEDTKLGNDFEVLSKGEYEKLWNVLAFGISQIITRETVSEESILLEALILIEKALKNNTPRAGLCTEFHQLLSLVNVPIKLSEECELLKLKINETWLKSNFAAVPNMALNTYKELSAQIAKDVLVVKKLYALRTHLTAEIILTQTEPLKNALMNSAIIGNDSGQKFFGHVCSLSKDLVELTFKTISFDLTDCSKEKAANYGSIILMSMRNALDELTPVFKDNLQNMMESFIKVHRKKLVLPTHARNLMIVISCWNVEVHHKTSNNFILMMTECYEPIVWKFLQSGISYERCNAADLFMKAFPLEIPGDPVKNSELFKRQLEQMEEMLRDDCHIVRIIAVTEICNILAVYWTQFSSAHILKLLTIILNDHARDASNYEVRKMVWKGITQFINSEPAYNYIKQLLPDLGHHINDTNPFVKVEFVKLLIAIRDKKDPGFKYSQVVSTNDLLKLLGREGIVVGSVIVQLLMPNCYKPGMEPTLWMKKFCWIIANYRESFRNFFLCSKKALPLDDALLIMFELMMHIGGYIKKKVDICDSDNDENDPSVGNVSRTSMFEKNKSMTVAPNAFDKPDIVSGIFEIIGLLWLIHIKQLHIPANQSKLKKLEDTYMQFAPSFISYYKGSQLFQSIVALSANIPTKTLNAGSITLPGYCLKRLKMASIDCSPAESEEKWVLMLCLVLWGRSGSILEQVLLWIQDAFEVKEDTIGKPVKRVKISDTIGPNPNLALHFLDLLLEKDISKEKVMRKHRIQVLETFRAMEPIKEFVFRRLLQGRPFSYPLLTDTFLESCFKRYTKLIPLLYQNKENRDIAMEADVDSFFDIDAEILSLIKWARDDMLPILQSDECPDLPLLIAVLNSVLYAADNVIFIAELNQDVYTKVVDLLSAIFSMEHKLPFIRESSRIARALEFHAERTKEADYFWFHLIPKVICDTFSALVSRPYTSHELDSFQEDLREVKINIRKILEAYVFYWVRHCSKKAHDTLKIITQKAIVSIKTVLIRDIPNEKMEVPVYASFNKLNLSVGTILASFYGDDILTKLFLSVLKENLGRTVKILLADITILYLLAKCKNRKWHGDVNIVAKEVSNKLKRLKSNRESNELHGITLNHVDEVVEDNAVVDNNFEIPSSQIASAAAMSHRTNDGPRDSATNTNIAIGTRDSCPDTHMATGTRDSAADTHMATGTRSSATDTFMATGTRDSATNTHITTGTRGCSTDIATNIAELRINELMDCNDELCPPSSQMFSQPSQPLSNIATQGSQEVPITLKSPEKRRDEEDLINDFILVGEHLLESITTILISPCVSNT